MKDERKALRHVGRGLTRPGAHAVGTPLEAAARSGELNGLAEAQLPEVGIDPGMSLLCCLPALLAVCMLRAACAPLACACTC